MRRRAITQRLTDLGEGAASEPAPSARLGADTGRFQGLRLASDRRPILGPCPLGLAGPAAQRFRRRSCVSASNAGVATAQELAAYRWATPSMRTPEARDATARRWFGRPYAQLDVDQRAELVEWDRALSRVVMQSWRDIQRAMRSVTAAAMGSIGHGRRRRLPSAASPRRPAPRRGRPHARRRQTAGRRARGSPSADPDEPAPPWGWRQLDLTRSRA